MFQAAVGVEGGGNLALSNTQRSLGSCSGSILDAAAYADIREREVCASTWCGQGTCVVGEEGSAACLCDPGFAARRFVDLDGEPSVHCVPEESPVDLSAGGVTLPSSCANARCGLGRCVDQGGFPACVCDEGAAAAVGPVGFSAPTCVAVAANHGSLGADDYSQPAQELAVCAPRPPSCPGGWLERVEVARQGVECAGSVPDPEDLVMPPPPVCVTGATGGGGCAVSPRALGSTVWVAGLLGLALAVIGRRRRRR